jgi:hypothetical protein
MVAAALERIEQIADEIRALDPETKMGDLMDRMAAAGAWPPAGEDKALTWSQLWIKYRP